ncbi:MAG: hypothetical protein LBC14_06225 [Desulfovibrio sp.]|nr:hypothetical protein [Desulfovibrio sp.]
MLPIPVKLIYYRHTFSDISSRIFFGLALAGETLDAVSGIADCIPTMEFQKASDAATALRKQMYAGGTAVSP